MIKKDSHIGERTHSQKIISKNVLKSAKSAKSTKTAKLPKSPNWFHLIAKSATQIPV